MGHKGRDMLENTRPALEDQVRFARIEKDMEHLKSDQEKLAAMIREIHQGMTESERRLSEHSLVQIEKKTAELKSEMDKLAKDLRTELKGAVDDLQERIDGISKLTTEMKTQLDANAVQMTKMSESVDRIERMIAKLEGAWDTIKIVGPVALAVAGGVKWVLEHPEIIAKFTS